MCVQHQLGIEKCTNPAKHHHIITRSSTSRPKHAVNTFPSTFPMSPGKSIRPIFLKKLQTNAPTASTFSLPTRSYFHHSLVSNHIYLPRPSNTRELFTANQYSRRWANYLEATFDLLHRLAFHLYNLIHSPQPHPFPSSCPTTTFHFHFHSRSVRSRVFP